MGEGLVSELVGHICWVWRYHPWGGRGVLPSFVSRQHSPGLQMPVWFSPCIHGTYCPPSDMQCQILSAWPTWLSAHIQLSVRMWKPPAGAALACASLFLVGVGSAYQWICGILSTTAYMAWLRAAESRGLGYLGCVLQQHPPGIDLTSSRVELDLCLPLSLSKRPMLSHPLLASPEWPWQLLCHSVARGNRGACSRHCNFHLWKATGGESSQYQSPLGPAKSWSWLFHLTRPCPCPCLLSLGSCHTDLPFPQPPSLLHRPGLPHP